MESEKGEKIRAQTAATAAKKLSAKVKEREHSCLRREADRVTSQETRLQKQQHHPVSSRQCQESQRKQQNNEQQTRWNQLIHQQNPGEGKETQITSQSKTCKRKRTTPNHRQ